MFHGVRQVAAPGVKLAVFDCILFSFCQRSSFNKESQLSQRGRATLYVSRNHVDRQNPRYGRRRG